MTWLTLIFVLIGMVLGWGLVMGIYALINGGVKVVKNKDAEKRGNE